MKKLLEKFKIATIAGTLSIGNAQAEPIAEYTNYKGDKSEIDCSTLVIAPNKKGKPSAFMTCSFAEAINPKGEICNYTNALSHRLDDINLEQKYKLTQAAIAATIHFGRAHDDCITKAAHIDGRSKVRKYIERGMTKDRAKEKALSEIEKLYGPNWQTKTSCSLKRAIASCEKAMGLD